MTDRLEKLEAELAAMRPRALPSDVFDGIETQLREKSKRRWGDRMLICSMCSGALAACVILVTLISEPVASLPVAGPASPVNDAMRFGEYPLAFARAGDTMFDQLK